MRRSSDYNDLLLKAFIKESFIRNKREDLFENKKKQNLVTFPLENLNLTNYVVGYIKYSYIYDLYGVCNHSGNVLGGHYTGYVKNASGKWYEFNDTRVTLITNPNVVISPRAYCLFYRKKSVV